jgi:hypothetical protein
MSSIEYLGPNPVETFLSTQSLPRQTGVLIPLYIYPADVFTNVDYNGLIDVAKTYHRVPITVVINPGSGPGTVADGNYTVAIRRMQGAGITVLGYVHATNASRALSLVKADVDTWLSLYPAIDGIFVDEMSNDDSAPHRAYFTELTNYVHARRLYPVVGNPGTVVVNTYFTESCADVIVVYENDGYPLEATIKGDFDGGFMDVDYRRRAGLAYNVSVVTPSVRIMQKYLGMVYTTADTGANPWDTVSTGLATLMGLLDAG